MYESQLLLVEEVRVPLIIDQPNSIRTFSHASITTDNVILYIWLFWLCEILALLGQNGGKEIMAHINFGSPRV